MKVNNLNYGVQMAANRYKTKLNKVKSVKAQNLSSRPQSFGMKMNNQHAAHKDRVSFGTPKWWKNIKIGVGSFIGGQSITSLTEIGKMMFDEPSTPRELEARFVGDSLVATQAGITAATCATGNFIASAVEPMALIENENTIVEAITDVYGINKKEEVSKIKSEVGIVDIVKYGAGAGSIAQATMLQITKDAAKEGASHLLKEVASNVPLIGGIARTGISTASGKTLVEKTIKACKKARPRR
ncbi:MAG: hypothetical protein BHW64_04520 [Candidatus Melainabacteria bacterium LEY3_CP_29_8]|nr:MAG: hypothetical protein BHW64_04520 [Candidatus Melainabacteria bacterium LEY3_CP_29_8]